MTSRERLLAALTGGQPDHVPCSFMIFSAMRARSRDDLDSIGQQLDLGLDPVVELATLGTGGGADHRDLPGPPLHFHPDVQVHEWTGDTPGGRLIHRRYDTPAGPLTTAVRWTDDWTRGPHVPLFDDWVIPRSHKRLIETDEDLDRLAYLLVPVTDEARAQLREAAAPKLAFAKEHGLLVAGAYGVGLDAAAWLCGHENLIWAMADRPEWFARLVGMLHVWNVSRMEAMLELGVDLFIRRAWYEGADFFSPPQFRRFVMPTLAHEAEIAHAAGATFGYINTSGTLPLVDSLIEAGMDALIGVDPVQGARTDLREMKRAAAGNLTLWGGVNGFLTMERGTPEEVRREVQTAMSTLGPDRFILSPVDNVTQNTDHVWQNVAALLDTWRRLR